MILSPHPHLSSPITLTLALALALTLTLLLLGLLQVLSKSDGVAEKQVGTPLYMSPEVCICRHVYAYTSGHPALHEP